MNRARRLPFVRVESLENRAMLASVGTLLQYDFDTSNAWPVMSADVSPGGSTTLFQGGYGTIDVEGGTAGSNAIRLSTTAPTTGPWTSALNSGPLAISNSETNLGKLTLSFTLSASQARTVKVYATSYDTAGGTPTGTLQTEISPAAAYYNQRFAIDLSTMKPVGGGTFNPTAAFVSFRMEISSTAGWNAAAPCQLRLDNVNYAKPAYYVSPTGSNSNNGLSEATAFQTAQKALDNSQPGDIILMMGGTYDNAANTNNRIHFAKGGTPANWVTLKNYPGQTPTIYNEWWNAILIGNGSSAHPATSDAVAYVEIRGLHVLGDSPKVGSFNAPDGPYDPSSPDADEYGPYAPYIGQADPRTNSNGISIDGRYETNKPHDIRIADNVVDLCSGGGLGGGAFDRIMFENNISRDNGYWDIYATSGFSILSSYNFDAATGNYTRILRNNISSGNIHKEIWKSAGRYSDGNGIIIDVNNNAGSPAVGRTLVTNNLTFNNGGSGIHAFSANHVDIYNNTAYLNSASSHLQYGQIFAHSSSDVRIYNNILVAPVANTSAGEPPEEINSGDASFFQRNIYFGGNKAPVKGFGDIVADPQFALPSIDETVADFRLQSTSPAIDAATTSRFTVLDLLGNVRNGAPDIGAYEYYASTPTVVAAATALPATVSAKSTALTVVAGDDDGPTDLIYTWSAVSKPNGAADPTFSVNATNTAKAALATFSKAGTYSLQVTVTDAHALSSTSAVTVTVAQTLTNVAVSPSSTVLNPKGTKQFTATAYDQFGSPFLVPPTFTWTKTSGVGSVSSTGLYTAPTTTGSFTLSASTGGLSASASGTVTTADITPPTLRTAVSSKQHGSSGTFNLVLALGGATKTVEPRVNGANKLIFTFSEPVKAADGALNASEFVVTNAAFSSVSISGNTLTLNLKNIVDRKYETVTLKGLTDLAGNTLTGVATLTVGNLFGDTDQSRTVTAADQQKVTAAINHAVTAANFLLDINASGGTISTIDQQLVKNNLTHVLS